MKAVVAVQNLIELYAVITDKRRVEHPLTPTKAKELIEFYKGSNIKVIAPTSQTIDTVARLIEKHSPKSQSPFTIITNYLIISLTYAWKTFIIRAFIYHK